MPQDAKPNVKGSGKLPKYALPVAAVATVLLVLYLKKKQAASSEGTSSTSETEALNRQSFIPVTGENVAGVGASGGASGGGTGGGEGLTQITELFKFQSEEAKEARRLDAETRKSEQEALRQLIANLGTGGGAPTTQGAGGVVAAPPQYGGTPAGPPPPPAAPPPPPKPSASCPAGWDYNPADGPPSPHSCYKYSRERCPNPQYPYKHVYQDGHVVCSNK